MDREELSKVLLELTEEETGETYSNVGEQTELRADMHLDSLDMVSLILSIERHFGIDIETDQLGDMVTVGEMLDLLQSKLQDSSDLRAA